MKQPNILAHLNIMPSFSFFLSSSSSSSSFSSSLPPPPPQHAQYARQQRWRCVGRGFVYWSGCPRARCGLSKCPRSPDSGGTWRNRLKSQATVVGRCCEWVRKLFTQNKQSISLFHRCIYHYNSFSPLHTLRDVRVLRPYNSNSHNVTVVISLATPTW